MPNWGGGATGALGGAATGAALGSFLPVLGTGVGAGIGGLVGGLKGLFSGGKKKDGTDTDALMKQATTGLQNQSTRLQQEGQDLSGMGAEAIAPVLNYFKALTGNNPAALMEAVRPETGRVVDQYDAARRSAGQFGARGGGQSEAISSSYTQQAQQIADVTTQAKRGAVEGLAALGPQLAQLGLTAERAAAMDLDSIISAVTNQQYIDATKRGQNMAALGGVGEAAGSLLGMFLTRPGGAWGPAKTATGTG